MRGLVMTALIIGGLALWAVYDPSRETLSTPAAVGVELERRLSAVEGQVNNLQEAVDVLKTIRGQQ